MPERDATTTAARAIAATWEKQQVPMGEPHPAEFGTVKGMAQYIRDETAEEQQARMAEAVVDAVRPLIIAEEHDRLRNQIAALGLAYRQPNTASADYWEGFGDAVEAVLALLGESTQ